MLKGLFMFLFRDAKQFTGLTDCQARSQAKLNFHFNASLSAVTLAKLEARQQTGEAHVRFQGRHGSRLAQWIVLIGFSQGHDPCGIIGKSCLISSAYIL